MDSVPYEFCEDVFGRIDATRAAYREYADLLTALWREAARTCAEKIWRFSIDIWKDGEQWMCNLQDWDRADEEEGPISIDQLVAMDRRWIRVMSVEVGAGVDDETSFEVSKEDISQKLIPFLNRQSLHCCSFQIWIHSTYDASEYLDIFQKLCRPSHTPWNSNITSFNCLLGI
ncbi:hypothetical protein QR680_010842 [Steinernema hermaphroditum]|uniref:Uncharacterized protein n=1 Tax=Steinernema hermaphroditum TaxID=289476 RepID=A0AA39MCH1_9BILA|nr:hypothetical protein QR680_010842 [Steinernema hermaphroditum]